MVSRRVTPGEPVSYSAIALAGNLGAKPFFWARLDKPTATEFAARLKACAKQQRRWYTLAATYENPRRLRLMLERTPEFESSAAPLYVRGDVLLVSGSPGVSCNIAFSSGAAADLSECLTRAMPHARRWVEFRVASRKRAMVEFIPDTELESMPSREHAALGRAGLALATKILPPENFSDWER
jgi:hypothetical protein